MENTNALINTVAASGADIGYTNGTLTIAVDSGTFPAMFVPNIKNFTKTTGVAETSQVSTSTNAAIANSQTYELVIVQNVGAENGAPVTFTATYTSEASGATEQQVVDAFIAQINGQTGASEIKVTATDGGANVVTLTARTGYPFFTATGVTNVTVTASVTGVAARGIGADLVTAGVAGAVVGTTYTGYIFNYFSSQPAQMGAELNAGLNTLTLYVNQGDVDFTAFDQQLRFDVTPLAETGGLAFSPRTIAIGGLVPAVSTDFNNSSAVTTEVYIGEIFIPANTVVTGIALFNGSDVSGSVNVALANSAGAVVANSALAGTAGSGTDAYQRIPFTATYFAVPGTYYILSQYNNAAARYNSPILGTFGAAVQITQVFGTFTTVTPPTTFTTNVANIASLY